MSFPGVYPQQGVDRRIGQITVSEEWLSGLFAETESWTTFRCERGLPVGARLIEITHSRQQGNAILHFEHESFEPGIHPVLVAFGERTQAP
ncbi:hypothetical protein LCGC14_2095280 [marine sediment metagenome]|uniref:Uncharacterized protein n=1 Tax=marine sediment metagenome TaxID=412755 RepID=A0A0F9GPP8_9ZZZZ